MIWIPIYSYACIMRIPTYSPSLHLPLSLFLSSSLSLLPPHSFSLSHSLFLQVLVRPELYALGECHECRRYVAHAHYPPPFSSPSPSLSPSFFLTHSPPPPFARSLALSFSHSLSVGVRTPRIVCSCEYHQSSPHV